MQKQLSKKSHKATQSSIDDFMKHIKRYNLQSQRTISPKPLLYMYTNGSRYNNLQTLQKSRSKSKTLSSGQYHQSKRALSKNIRLKVEKMLSIDKKQKNKSHKKSISSIVYNEKSHKKNNKSTIQFSDKKIKNKTKLNQFKLKDDFVPQKTKTKYDTKFTQRTPNQSSIQVVQNPASLIQIYSKKILKVQKYLQQKSKLGSMLCHKFHQILNQIVQSLIQNLKRSLNSLQSDIEKRLLKKFTSNQIQSQKKHRQIQQRNQIKIEQLQNVCNKLSHKIQELSIKQNYNNCLIYNLRKSGIDIDRQFGKALWNVQTLGGRGYDQEHHNLNHSNPLDQSYQSNHSDHLNHSNQSNSIHNRRQDIYYQDKHQSDDQFQFRQHPNAQLKKNEHKKNVQKSLIR